MASIEIDGDRYDVSSGDNLLQTVLSLGLNLPYFCWHPSLGSVGACRQCAVIQYADEDDERGRLTMACMTPVTEGMRIAIKAETAREFRAGVLELLMTNHPHDCPVCEEGGECHLQDMTVMTGQTFRKYRGKKRTHRNQYLGPFINHEMNRCIACYRCVRYYQDYAGGNDLQALSSHNSVYFGRHEDGVLENEFSGNLVEVCPTGVFTDKTLSGCYSRKWDLQATPSICVHCALGCNTSPGERYGTLRRVVNRYNGDVNGYFLCDRGRFGYDFVNSDARVRKPLIDGQPAISRQAALQHFETLLADRSKTIGIGSPRATVEANYALRESVGPDNFYIGVEETEYELTRTVAQLLQKPPARIPTLREVEQADAALVLGEDVTNTAPLLVLALRQSVRNRSFEIGDGLHIPRWQDEAIREAAQHDKSPLFIASHGATRLDDIATDVYRADPQAIARWGFAIAHAINRKAPGVSELSKTESDQIQAIATALREAKRPLIVTGTGSQSQSIIEAASNIAKALSAEGKALSLVVPECNTIGLAMIGGEHFSKAQHRLESGAAETVIILENDLYRRGTESLIDSFLSSANHVVAIDHIMHTTAKKAELVLPAAAFAETEGTLVSAEGRAQRFFAAMAPSHDIQCSWRWLGDAGALNGWRHLDEVTAACCKAIPVLAPIENAAPNAGFRLHGLKIPRQPHRYSGRTAMLANRNVAEPKQPEDTESALSVSMEGITDHVPPALNPGVWAPSWNSNQAVNKFQDEIGGHLTGGDPGVRLFDTTGRTKWYSRIPKSADANDGAAPLVSVAIHHIFGSEELSVLSAAVAERIPAPYVAIGKDLATTLSVENNEEVEVSQTEQSIRLPAKVLSDLPKGVVGIPTGLPDVPLLEIGARIKLQKIV